MSVISIISVCVSCLSCLVGGGVVWKLIDIGRQNGKMEQRVVTLETRTVEDRTKDSAKFDRLYEGKNETNERLIRLETKIDVIMEKLEERAK